MENKNMEVTTNVVSNSKGGKIAAIVGAVGVTVLGGVAALIYKKKKNKVVEAEEVVENNEETTEE